MTCGTAEWEMPPEILLILQLIFALFLLRYFVQLLALALWGASRLFYYSIALLGLAACVAVYDVYIRPRQRGADSHSHSVLLDNPFTSHTRSSKARASDTALLTKHYYDYRAKERAPYRSKQFLQSAATQRSIDDIMSLVSRDFVASWYSQYISSEAIFTNSFDKLLRFILKSFADKLILVYFLIFSLHLVYILSYTHLFLFHLFLLFFLFYLFLIPPSSYYYSSYSTFFLLFFLSQLLLIQLLLISRVSSLRYIHTD